MSEVRPFWTDLPGNANMGAIATIAIHDGHDVRADVLPLLALSDFERLYEEDPHTGEFADLGRIGIVANRSRFEVDLNRSRDKAVYIVPEDAWGLKVWKDPNGPPQDILEQSLQQYDEFFSHVKEKLTKLEEEFGVFCVFDLHSYNHRRDGTPADPAKNPEINIGTSNMDADRFGPLVDRFVEDLRKTVMPDGRQLDVRTNIKFRGGNLSKWVHTTFPRSGCSLAIEFKKFWMDELTGVVDRPMLDALHVGLEATLPGLLEELAKISQKDEAACQR